MCCSFLGKNGSAPKTKNHYKLSFGIRRFSAKNGIRLFFGQNQISLRNIKTLV